jgi:hypothetical protein
MGRPVSGKGLLACAVTAALFVATTCTAQANSASRSGGLLLVLAGEGEANAVSIRAEGARIGVEDSGAPLIAGSLCRARGGAMERPAPIEPVQPVGTTRVSCDASALAAVVVLADDQPDVVTALLPADVVLHVAGGAGDDMIDGSAGASVLQGEAGDDRIVASENTGGVDIAEGGSGADSIDVVAGGGSAIVRCGGGFDIVELDSADRPSDGCEGRSFPAPVAGQVPDPSPRPQPAPPDAVAPRLPSDQRQAAASGRRRKCLLHPRHGKRKLSVKLTGPRGRAYVAWTVYKKKRPRPVAKTGVDPVIANRRERLTSIRRNQQFDTVLTTPQPCPH